MSDPVAPEDLPTAIVVPLGAPEPAARAGF